MRHLVAHAATLLAVATASLGRALNGGLSHGSLANPPTAEYAAETRLADVLETQTSCQYRQAATFPNAATSEQGAGGEKASAHFDLVVIGGGSGGVACARRAASYGASVALVEKANVGGTCVNLGCMPKKVMWLASNLGASFEAMPYYGFSVPNSEEDARSSAAQAQGSSERFPASDRVAFSWEKLRENRDAYVSRLRCTFERLLKEAKVTVFRGVGRLDASERTGEYGLRSAEGCRPRHAVLIQTSDGRVQRVTASHVLLATGTRRQVLDIPGAEFAISSDGFFQLRHRPRRVALIGAGYVSAELAGILRQLGTNVSVFMRGQRLLKRFDKEAVGRLEAIQSESGTQLHKGVEVVEISISKADGTKILPTYTFRDETDKTNYLDDALLSVHLGNGDAHHGFDQVIMAVNPAPDVEDLGLEEAGVHIDFHSGGFIDVDAFQNTNVPGIYAVGDVVGKAMLAPAAVAAGRLLADRLFGKRSVALDLSVVPTVVFSHPPLAAVGLTEEDAKSLYGEENINVYTSTFVDSFYAAWSIPQSTKPKSFIKMVCLKKANDKVLGLHILGRNADEMLQGFAVAIKLGATKADFSGVLAIHPTAAEEVVTLPDLKTATRTARTVAENNFGNCTPVAESPLQRPA
ncbi:putative glutathione reductase [Neospora caninum Liverpool]|uniref:Glutathione reductase, putative n=1 Tax=Neospora caninum (strain Liverpool) TaxID=572307 RepID=F0VPR3_NEOCL|nr:putative glutathione reductase [Neospora caninum Liverpool]CBZ55710.1 putative glutathione reductase [Neospora caninum Liverpool]CEL70453.1 TPA: glutathione reductase, putative [Neospora caninum Liverpool]|eukprot:XP_003885736.1 putative glutathione reductase [Neospora caninum Liverpool]